MSFLFLPTFASRAAAVPFSITLADSPVTDSNATTYTFSSASLGAAASPRKIVIAFSARLLSNATPNATSASVGGNACTEAVNSPGSSGYQVTEMWYVDLDAGTSGDVVINMGVSQDAAGLCVFSITGAATGGPHDTIGTEGSGGSDPSGTIDIPAGGGLICLADTTGTNSFSWTGVTERVDKIYDVDSRFTGASDIFASAVSGRTISVDQGPATSRMVCASWAAA